MQKLTCPWCGPRAQTEFEYYCDASVVDRNFTGETAGEAIDRVFLRDDHIGFHQEVWQHVHGCRGWLRLERHNRSHDVRGATPCRAGPDRAGESS